MADKRIDKQVKDLLKSKMRSGLTGMEWENCKIEIAKIFKSGGRMLAKEQRAEIRKVSDAITLLRKPGNTGPGLKEAIERLQSKHRSLMKKRWDTLRLKYKVKDWEAENWATKFLMRRSLGDCKHEMPELINESTGQKLTAQSDIEEYVAEFYGELYKLEQVTFSKEDLRFPGVNTDTNGDIFTIDEIKKALSQLHDKKAPGPDGLTPAFYKKYWGLIAVPFVVMINEAIRANNILPSFKSGIITLLCKDMSKKDNIKAWRPITLLNTDYKILTKALANRIHDCLPDIVSESQAANINQRSAELNIIGITNVMHWIKSSGNTGGLLALDSEKAFDRVNHSFLFECLKKVNFHPDLVRVIELLYKDCTSKVLVNGSLTRSIKINRGVRQGCPLSPALFVISMEPFLQLIKLTTPQINLPVLGNTVPIFAFADDVTVIIKSPEHINNVLQAVQVYERISGGRINKGKSEALFFGTKSVSTDRIYGIPVRNTVKILGIHFDSEGPSNHNWKIVLAAIKDSVKKLQDIKSSMFSRIQIARTHLFSKVQYVSHTVPIGKETRMQIDKTVFPFIWGSRVEALSRECMKEGKLNGGYNITDVDLLSRAAQIVWNLRALYCDISLVREITRYSLGLGIRIIESRLDNSKPRANLVRQAYKKMLADIKLIKEKKPELLDTSMEITGVMDVIRQKKHLEVRKPIPNRNPNWKNINAEFLESKRKSFSWRLAHGILPRLNYHRNTRNVQNACPLCSDTASLRHFFYECPYLNTIKSTVKQIFGLSSFPYSAVRFLDPTPQNKSARKQFILLVTEINYQNWLMRCGIAHGKEAPQQQEFRKRCSNEIKWTLKREHARLSNEDFDRKWGTPALIYKMANRDIEVIF